MHLGVYVNVHVHVHDWLNITVAYSAIAIAIAFEVNIGIDFLKRRVGKPKNAMRSNNTSLAQKRLSIVGLFTPSIFLDCDVLSIYYYHHF